MYVFHGNAPAAELLLNHAHWVHDLVQNYQKRISGPLLDRIDIQIEVPRLSEDELLQSRPGESSRDIRSRVKRARDAQAEAKSYRGSFALLPRYASACVENTA